MSEDSVIEVYNDDVVDELLKLLELADIDETVDEDSNVAVDNDEIVDEVDNKVAEESVEPVVDEDILRDEREEVPVAEEPADVAIALMDEIPGGLEDDIPVDVEIPATEGTVLEREIESIEALTEDTTDDVALPIEDVDVGNGRLVDLDEYIETIAQTACEITF